MKNCDTCANFTRIKTWNNRVGICDRTDYNINYMKGKPCKHYKKATNNKRKVAIDVESEIDITIQIEEDMFNTFIDADETGDLQEYIEELKKQELEDYNNKL